MSTSEEATHVDGVGSKSLITARTNVSPRHVTALILRVRALVYDWISIEVEEESITSAEGLVNEEAVRTFLQAGGDLAEAVPYALLEARKTFSGQADDGGPEGNLNELRGLTCEVLARRVVARIEAAFPEREARQADHGSRHSHVCLSKRFTSLEEDGDEAAPTSALESAVDQNCILFLSAPEAQRCAEEIWSGQLVQQFGDANNVYFEPHVHDDPSFFGRMHPGRLSVPKYAYYSGIAIHVAFIIIYTFSTLEYSGLDGWEIALWIFVAGNLLDDLTRWFKMGGLDKIISFWVVIDLCTDALFVTAFTLRVTGWIEQDNHKSAGFRLLAFQFLSCTAPLLWMQLLKLADGLQYFGVIQIVLLRMLQEAMAFFVLLAITAIGFAQALFALDAADGHRVPDSLSFIANLLIAGILGQPDLEAPSDKFGAPFGTILFYVYVFVTVMLLANILVAFFASAYDKTVDAADSVFKAYFCSKVVSSVRAPDQYVYLPPFNLIEAVCIAPFELVLSRKTYATINKYVQGTLFCIPLTIIALYESNWLQSSSARRLYLEMVDDIPEERVRRLAHASGVEDYRDPVVREQDDEGASADEGAPQRLVISHRSFKELSAELPVVKSDKEEADDAQSNAGGGGGGGITTRELALLMAEIKALRKEVAALKK